MCGRVRANAIINNGAKFCELFEKVNSMYCAPASGSLTGHSSRCLSTFFFLFVFRVIRVLLIEPISTSSTYYASAYRLTRDVCICPVHRYRIINFRTERSLISLDGGKSEGLVVIFNFLSLSRTQVFPRLGRYLQNARHERSLTQACG